MYSLGEHMIILPKITLNVRMVLFILSGEVGVPVLFLILHLRFSLSLLQQ